MQSKIRKYFSILCVCAIWCFAQTSGFSQTDTTTFVPSQVYPNPFTSNLYIKLNKNPKDIKEISIYDAIGNLVFSFDITEIDENIIIWNGTNFSGASVSNGVYICYIRSRKRTESFKIQKL
ncbi:MAG: Secretion system C-terminal sorting domain [Bacteroidota bacterium]|jgi:flagellar hook assembly protein FlgD